MGSTGGGGVYTVNFRVLRVPDHLGTDKKSFGANFFEKNAFFDPKLAQNAHKMGQNGVHWGVYRVNFGFSRVPDPLGVEIMQTNFFGKPFWPILAQKGLGKISGRGLKN